MQIADLFSKNITRPINGVVKADERGPEAVSAGGSEGDYWWGGG